MRFRLMRGLHQQNGELRDENGQVLKDENGKPRLGSVTYSARDPKRNIVESDVDLEKLFGSDKFQNLDRLTVGGESADLQRRIKQLEAENERLRKTGPTEGKGTKVPDLESMSTDELYEFAEKRGIAVDQGLSKEELVETIKFELETSE